MAGHETYGSDSRDNFQVGHEYFAIAAVQRSAAGYGQGETASPIGFGDIQMHSLGRGMVRYMGYAALHRLPVINSPN